MEMAELLVSLLVGVPDDDGVDGIALYLTRGLAWVSSHGGQWVDTRFLNPFGHCWHGLGQVLALAHHLKFCHSLVRWPWFFKMQWHNDNLGGQSCGRVSLHLPMQNQRQKACEADCGGKCERHLQISEEVTCSAHGTSFIVGLPALRLATNASFSSCHVT